MAAEGRSPPPARSARRRSFSENGRAVEASTDSRKGDRSTRELSPWSARRALTEQLQGRGSEPRQSRERDRSWSVRQTVEMKDTGNARPPSRGGKRGKSRSPPPRKPRDRSREKARERSRDRKSKDASEAGSAVRGRDASPEPYRKPRESSRERKREKSKDRDRSRDNYRDRSRDRRRDRTGERKRDRSKERRRDRSKNRRDRSRDRDKEKKRDRSRDRNGDKKRDRSRDRRRDRSRSKPRRSRSPIPYRSRKHRSPSTSASPPPKRRKRTRSHSRSRSRPPRDRDRKPLPSQEVSFRGLDDSARPPSKYGGAPTTLEKPNFKPTGLLAKAANKVEGTKISLKYHEPPEARKPPSSAQWRMFVFKGDDVVDTIELYTRSCWLFGRSREVADYVLEHPSSSGQHAVIQFRYIQKTVEDEFGVKQHRGKVKPYIIDLESSNGTELNGERIETTRYFELRDKDILKFAGSEREYVVMLPPPESHLGI